MYRISLVILFIYSLLAQYSAGFSPVILIPGDGGSQLEAKLNRSASTHYICEKTSNGYFNIWLNLELLVPFVIDCWVDNTKLVYDNKTRTTSNPEGVDIRVPGWGTPEAVEWISPTHQKAGSYFSTIADALVKMGYQRNVSIRGAPYDFRKAPNENVEFFVKLKTLAEETYKMNNNTPVTIIGHSMGGAMAQHFLRLQTQAWKDQYIRRLIGISTPWGGAVKALKVFAIGDDLGALMLRESTMRAQQVTCPSLAWLLPSRALWKPTEVLVTTDKYNYTLNDLQRLFLDMNLPAAWEMRKDVERFQDDFAAPGVELHCVYGTDIATVEQLSYKPGTWLDGYPTLVKGDGDGTVNLRSLSACLHWKKRRNRTTLNKGKVIKALPLSKAEHLQILHDQRVIDYITTVMKN
ncbi:phospholipase A2 group XV isoform X1 [Plutella xylostella]|uniref:phospholipase A2 group XV isoform X1 n=1 Tax=Plutella xylostella TaxID=51655 RepID=UPI00203256EF|nr:phospholipase A2 group XV isoform X1 [Plutella xylostella]